MDEEERELGVEGPRQGGAASRPAQSCCGAAIPLNTAFAPALHPLLDAAAFTAPGLDKPLTPPPPCASRHTLCPARHPHAARTPRPPPTPLHSTPLSPSPPSLTGR